MCFNLHQPRTNFRHTNQTTDRELCGPLSRQTLVTFAAAKGNEDMVKLLVEGGMGVVDPSRRLYDTSKPLIMAISSGNSPIVGLLLENGVPVEDVDEQWRTPLALAAEKGHESIVRLLQRYAAPMEVPGAGFFCAIQNGDIGALHQLLKSGSDSYVETRWGYRPLFVAVAHGQLLAVNLLLEHGAKVRLIDDPHPIIAHLAVRWCYTSSNLSPCTKILTALAEQDKRVFEDDFVRLDTEFNRSFCSFKAMSKDFDLSQIIGYNSKTGLKTRKLRNKVKDVEEAKRWLGRHGIKVLHRR